MPMDTGQHGGQPGGGEGSRRKFLRQFGITAAATAAFTGAADAAGLGAAFGASKNTRRDPVGRPMKMVRPMPAHELPRGEFKQVQVIRAQHAQAGQADPGRVDGAYVCWCIPGACPGACHPAGVWCHYCFNTTNQHCIKSGYYCIEGCSPQQASCG
jgi:hypothetical protein